MTPHTESRRCASLLANCSPDVPIRAIKINTNRPGTRLAFSGASSLMAANGGDCCVTLKLKIVPVNFCVYASANCSQATARPSEHLQAGKRLGGH